MNLEMVPIAIVGIVFGAPLFTGIVICFVKMVESTVKHSNDTKLKIRLIERGYSASEIERIVNLNVKNRSKNSEWEPIVPAKPVKPSAV